MHSRNWVLASIFLCTSSGSALWAQTGAARIQGTVADTSGAVIPQANVTAMRIETNTSFDTRSNQTGFFVFPSLQPGRYRVSVEFAGMEKWEGELNLQTGQDAELKPVLAIGASASKVTVAGDVTPLLTTTDGSLASIADRERIDQLPLNGRDFQNLLPILTPGLEGGVQGNYAPQAYGLRDQSVEFLLDGVSIRDASTGGLNNNRPGMDSIQEFRIEMSVPPAKFNTPSTVILATRSGTNDLHGSLFYTGRNNGFGLARARQDFYTKAPQLILNEYGVSGGGPLVIPRLYNGKNKTFFFIAYEALKQRSATTFSTSEFTPAMQNGDFSKLTDSGNRPITLYNPYTTQSAANNYARTPFPGNIIPISLRSPFAAYYFSVMPQPTQDVNPSSAANYFGPDRTVLDDSTGTVRIDHRFSDKDQIFGRWTIGNHFDFNRRTSGNTSPISLDNYWNYQDHAQRPTSVSITWNHIFSPSFFVETTLTGAHLYWLFDLSTSGGTEVVTGKLNLPNPLAVAGAPSLSNMGWALSGTGSIPRSTNTNPIGIAQNYLHISGSHHMEFGWRYQKTLLDTLPDQPGQGSISFASLATALYDPASGSAYSASPRTGDNAANFFLGAAGTYTVTQPAPKVYIRLNEPSGYFQDNWSITRDLTLNLGLRYDWVPPELDTHGTYSAFDFKNRAIVRDATVDQLIEQGATTQAFVNQYQAIGVKFETVKEAGWDSLVHVNQWVNFSPRTGFAYHRSIGGRTVVVRGGFGMYRYNIGSRAVISTGQISTPPMQGTITSDVSSAARTPDGLPNYGLRSVPTVIAGTTASAQLLNSASANAIARGVAVTALDHDLPSSLAREYNLTAESEIFRDTLLRVSYVGTQGRHLDQVVFQNGQPSSFVYYTVNHAAPPTGPYANVALRDYDQTTYGDIKLVKNGNYSNYNGMTVEVQRRFTNGLAFQWYYVLANAMWTNSGGSYVTNTAQTPDPVSFLPGSVPSNADAYNRFYNYSRDPNIPHQRINWNLVYDLPFGKGKRFLSSSHRLLDTVAGGWQLAAYSQSSSRYITLPTSNWGATSNVEIYGKEYPVQDCRSGPCINSYLWYNGYIPANLINIGPGGVNGVPANYKASIQPINPIPANPNPSDPNYSLYGTNLVTVPLQNGGSVRLSYNNGLNPFRNQYIPGPWASTVNSSLFKVISLSERLKLRINLDFFNVLNMPGTPLPDANTGLISLRNSNNSPRSLQWTARLNF